VIVTSDAILVQLRSPSAVKPFSSDLDYGHRKTSISGEAPAVINSSTAISSAGSLYSSYYFEHV
jgi:hypothetical protein